MNVLVAGDTARAAWHTTTRPVGRPRPGVEGDGLGHRGVEAFGRSDALRRLIFIGMPRAFPAEAGQVTGESPGPARDRRSDRKETPP